MSKQMQNASQVFFVVSGGLHVSFAVLHPENPPNDTAGATRSFFSGDDPLSQMTDKLTAQVQNRPSEIPEHVGFIVGRDIDVTYKDATNTD